MDALSSNRGSPQRMTDIRRFASRWPAIMVAAVLAQICGEVGTALVRAVTGMSGLGSTALTERLLIIIFGAIPGTLILSFWFTARIWNWAEAAVAAFSTSWSFIIGPAFFAIGDVILRAALGDAWVHLRTGSIAVREPFWAAGIALVMAPAEYLLWSSMSRSRTRAIYASILRSVREGDSNDPGRARIVLQGVSALRRVETSVTARLSTAVCEWATLWLGHPEGFFVTPDADPADIVDREVVALFGLPRPPA